jgi:hypothetical protein
MTGLYLKYGTWNDTTKVLDWSAEQLLNAISVKAVPFTKRITSTGLQGVGVSHKLYKKYGYEIIISADELADSTKYSWLISFFLADGWLVSINSDVAKRWGGSDLTQTTLVINTEKLPVEFLEGNKYLPEVKFECEDKYANSSFHLT